MAAFGKIDTFQEGEETFEHYTERLEQYFEANDIGNTEEADKSKRRAILLTVCGSKIYNLISDLLAPVKPKDKKFEELVKLVKDHFNPTPSEIVQRLKFNSRTRQIGESVSSYVAALRHLAEHCNFGVTLETALRDRLVCGINDEKIQSKLLAQQELTFKSAYDIAVSTEATTKNVKVIAESTSGVSTQPPAVNRVSAQPKGKQSRQTMNCYRCGGDHAPQKCKHKNSRCHLCSKIGHLQKKCFSRRSNVMSSTHGNSPSVKNKSGSFRPNRVPPSRQTGKVNSIQVEDDSGEAEYASSMFRVTSDSVGRKPYSVTIDINGVAIPMEIDTGAAKTVLGETAYKKTLTGDHSKSDKLRPSTDKLQTYTGEVIPILGSTTCAVKYGDFEGTLPVLVVKGNSPSLLGRNWLEEIRLDWNNIFNIRSEISQDPKTSALDEVLHKYDDIFKDGLGKVRGVQAKLYVDETAKPKYFKPRPVAYSMRDKISSELDRLINEGTIEPVQFSEWATPIVPILKSDGHVRICGDYKVTVNPVTKLDNYPIPKTEDLYATLGGGQEFSKLDLSQAYQQLELDPESRKFTTINTHRGLFQYNRLVYGLSSAPGIFQRTIENIVQGIPNVVVRIDDILVTGKTCAEHLSTLDTVLARLSDSGIRLKRDKCYFLAEEVTYLGHRINKDGIQPVPDKVRAIKESPAPTNVKELQAFLGLINYYSRYMPNLSTILAPLHELLVKDATWKWGRRQIDAWNAAKDLLQSESLLVHYDPTKPLVISCDASPYGLGAVLAHLENDEEKPIAYASRTLAPAEKNYSQLEKEGLSIIFAVKKFNQYLYGRPKFVIRTDHKPLLGLFQFDKAIPVMASGRIQRWALLLAGYNYELVYRKGVQNGNADGLSRLPLPETIEQVPTPGENILLIQVLDNTPVKSEQISEWTQADPILSKVYDFIQHGWPSKCQDQSFSPYLSRKAELSTLNGCILWGNRVVVPEPGRDKLLADLHEGHPGIVRMKGLSRSYVWWPGLDADIERVVHLCSSCQLIAATPAVAPLHPWDWPDRPWSRVHVDYAGPFMGHMFLVIMDAYSKWIEIFPTNSSNSTTTIEKLRQSFATHGLPEMLVSDNGPCFISDEFSKFTSSNGIQHVRSSPYHPASNGLAERAVRIFKEGMKKMSTSEGTLNAKLNRFLLSYRTTPQSTTGMTPSELLFNRRLRTKLDLVKPEIRKRVVKKQLDQKVYHDQHSKYRKFALGDNVQVRNFLQGPKWEPAEVTRQVGPLSYSVKFGDGKVSKRHVDHLRPRTYQSPASNPNLEITDSDSGISRDCVVVPEANGIIPDSESKCLSNESKSVSSESEMLNQRPKREIKKPVYLKDFDTS